jgi:tautomerase-like protein
MEGWDQDSIKKLLDTTHRVVLQTLGVPERDRYQIVYQHPPHEMIVQDTGLGFTRTEKVVVITITSRQRTEVQKTNLYKVLAQELHKDLGIDPQDVTVAI